MSPANEPEPLCVEGLNPETQAIHPCRVSEVQDLRRQLLRVAFQGPLYLGSYREPSPKTA